MSTRKGASREVALPVAVFQALRAEIEKDAGTLATVRALHQGGYRAGLAAAAFFDREAGGDAFALPQAAFWAHLSNYFAKRGWGTLEHRALHPGVGVLSSSDWAESSPGAGNEAGCGVSSGLLSGLLSQLAGEAVAVLEVRCRSRGDESCDFAFGSETAIHDLYGRMLDGADLEEALQAL
jgi:predicted hydrocarbon binding protein